MAKKKVKDKTKDEMLADMLNMHISKGNLTESQVKPEHKDKIKNKEG